MRIIHFARKPHVVPTRLGGPKRTSSCESEVRAGDIVGVVRVLIACWQTIHLAL